MLLHFNCCIWTFSVAKVCWRIRNSFQTGTKFDKDGGNLHMVRLWPESQDTTFKIPNPHLDSTIHNLWQGQHPLTSPHYYFTHTYQQNYLTSCYETKRHWLLSFSSLLCVISVVCPFQTTLITTKNLPIKAAVFKSQSAAILHCHRKCCYMSVRPKLNSKCDNQKLKIRFECLKYGNNLLMKQVYNLYITITLSSSFCSAVTTHFYLPTDDRRW